MDKVQRKEIVMGSHTTVRALYNRILVTYSTFDNVAISVCTTVSVTRKFDPSSRQCYCKFRKPHFPRLSAVVEELSLNRIQVFWDVTLCHWASSYKHFKGM
jgi:hypothetical protein